MQQKGMGLGGTIHLMLVSSVLVALVPAEPVQGLITMCPVLDLCGKILIAGWGGRGRCRGGFCEKTSETAPVLDRASVSQVENRPAVAQS